MVHLYRPLRKISNLLVTICLFLFGIGMGCNCDCCTGDNGQDVPPCAFDDHSVECNGSDNSKGVFLDFVKDIDFSVFHGYNEL